MNITKTHWGAMPDGRAVDLFHLDGGAGVTADIATYGARIVSLKSPDKNGSPGEIGLGFDSLDKYLAGTVYYGAIIGRVANRIRDGRFTLDGKEYRLDTDASGIHLHGGKKGYDAVLWGADEEDGRLRLDYLSPDGEEHYPGNLSVTVWYEIRGNELRIDYKATTDKPTPVNLTNHEFFNLNCCTGDVLSHELRMRADRYTPVDATLLPTGEIAPVAGTVMDFTTAKAIGRDLAEIPEGYDHNFVFAETDGAADQWLVSVHDPESGRTLEMATTEPCVQLYIGNFLDGSDIGRGGIAYKRRYGFCLEAQKHPDAVNHANFADTVLRPGETYRQTTVYRLGSRG